VVLAAQKSGVLYALDPDRGGEILWQTRIAHGVGAGEDIKTPGGVGFGVAADYRNAYVALNGALADPANPSGSITAVELKTGIVRWQGLYPQPNCSFTEAPCQHGGSQAVSVIPGSAFSGSLDGHLRAFSTIDGKLQWDFDTAKAFQAVNGIAAHGGPLDRGGATIVNGTVYITSGNALLAFSADAQ
jgi:polyvinyl alcohol dehydrogenase (cytochrome)